MIGRHDKPFFVNPAELPRPSGFNHGAYVPTGGGVGVLFIAGQIGCDDKGRIVSDRFTEQFDSALANLLTIVSEAGGRPESIGKLTIYVTDKAEYSAERVEIGEAYRRRMGTHFPAMTLVEVKGLLDPRARVEIEGYAVV